MKYQLKHLVANFDRKSQRDLMRELGAKSAIARVAKIPPAKRSAIARRAARMRWRKPRLHELDPGSMRPIAPSAK
jgi:hypothetical protein